MPYSYREAKVLRELCGDSFSPAVALSSHIYECGGNVREEQEKMVELVSDALMGNDVSKVFVQAGTGTGKSYAYAFPAAVVPGRYVISTSTNQLGDQLYKKDVPAVWDSVEKLGIPFAYALLKGRANYVCLLKHQDSVRYSNSSMGDNGDDDSTREHQQVLFEEFREEATETTLGNVAEESHLLTEVEVLGSNDGVAQFKKDDVGSGTANVSDVMAWVRTTNSGDRSEAPPVSDKVWATMSATSTECIRQDCPFVAECFAEKALQRAAKAKIVITNHAYLAHLMKRDMEKDHTGSSHGTLLDGVDAVVIDEAHDYPKAVSSAFTVVCDPENIRRTLNKPPFVLPALVAEHQRALLDLVGTFSEMLSQAEVSVKLPELPSELARVVKLIRSQLLLYHTSLSASDAPKELFTSGSATVNAMESAHHLTTLTTIADTLNSVLFNDPDTQVMWIDTTTHRPPRHVIRQAPLDVGPAINTYFEDTTLIATSATLAMGEDFSALLREYGIVAHHTPTRTPHHTPPKTSPRIITADVGSPFNYRNQGLLYIPTPHHIPPPAGKERHAHTQAVLNEITTLVAASGGRALLLFTTVRDTLQAAEHLRVHTPHLRILCHGEAPAPQLISEFVADETSVLCGTMGMWQGIDASGHTCSLVVINKIAFPPPTDLVTAAKVDTITKKGGNGFRDIIIPTAATTLAQASGRLIRTATDTGVVAILDPRLLTQYYGKKILTSLPPYTLTTEHSHVVDVLTAINAGRPHATAPPPQRATTRIGHAEPAKTIPKQRASSKPPQRRTPMTRAQASARTRAPLQKNRTPPAKQ